MTLFLSVNHADFRRGIDGLAALCEQQLKQDPMSGELFIFTNRRRNAIKILTYDGTGFWLALKRFSSGKLKWWPSATKAIEPIHLIDATQLTILVNQGHPLSASLESPWRKIASAVLPPIEEPKTTNGGAHC